jgi:hypothetical protein
MDLVETPNICAISRCVFSKCRRISANCAFFIPGFPPLYRFSSYHNGVLEGSVSFHAKYAPSHFRWIPEFCDSDSGAASAQNGRLSANKSRLRWRSRYRCRYRPGRVSTRAAISESASVSQSPSVFAPLVIFQCLNRSPEFS